MTEPTATDRAALRDRIAEALLTTRRTDYEGDADHRNHRYDARCALCAYDVDALAAAVLAVLPAPAVAEPADRAALRELVAGTLAYRRGWAGDEAKREGLLADADAVLAVLPAPADQAAKGQALARVRQLHDRLAGETDLTSPDDPITRGAAAKLIATALDGWKPTGAPQCDVEFEGGGRCAKPAGHRPPGSDDPHVPATDRAALRDRIAEALDNANHTHPCPATGSTYWTGCYHPDGTASSCHTDRRTAAVLADKTGDQPDDELGMLRRNLRRAINDAEIHAALHAAAEVRLGRVREAVSVRLAEDECGEQERRGYHSALSDVRRAMDGEDAELRRMAAAQQPKEARPSPTEELLATRCDACRHSLARHHQHGACTVVLCVCGAFQYPVEELPQ